MSAINNIYSGLPRNRGGNDKLDNSSGFRDFVCAENAGIPSMQSWSPISDMGMIVNTLIGTTHHPTHKDIPMRLLG